MGYNEEDYIQLSGIQHFRFCRRQWALIHIENQWKENVRTISGEEMHQRCHNSNLFEKRGETLIARDMRVFSATLGCSGACDVVEYHEDIKGIPVKGYERKYSLFPVEYKHGGPRKDNANELQLCAQAMCLEDMLCCDIPNGALYYGETKHRAIVQFTQELRQDVKNCLQEMHFLLAKGVSPKVKPSKACNACSLKEICLPQLMEQRSVRKYIESALKEVL